MTKIHIANELYKIHEDHLKETDRAYEVRLTRLVNELTVEDDANKLLSILEDCKRYLLPTRYAAFYALNILYRHNQEFSKLDALYQQYLPVFSDSSDPKRTASLQHLWANYCLEINQTDDSAELLEKTYQNAVSYSDNVGYQHLFAHLFAAIYERGGLKDPQSYLARWQDKALLAVNKAIDDDPSYAFYFCTKARILCMMGCYEEAKLFIHKAINIENSARQDYALCIGRYQYHKAYIEFQHQLRGIEAQMQDMARHIQSLEQQLAEHTQQS